MYIKTLHLFAFRNYRNESVEFKGQKTILLGNNAQGKSNLLEAVELLSTLKTHRTNRDRDLVLEGENTSCIRAILERTYGSTELSLTIPVQGRRTVAVNGEKLKRQLDFLGCLNTVEFSSLDLDLVRGSPECRRSWLDGLIIQLEPVYAYVLHQYQQVLRQRNALLKQIGKAIEDSQKDLLQLQLKLWDQKLVESGTKVTRRRARVLERLNPLAQAWHSKISKETERLQINYHPNVIWKDNSPEQVKQVFMAAIAERNLAEIQLGSTVVGPHRDEVEFSINNNPARFYGSQGQQRTLVLALKLAELELIEKVISEAPILLLDDVLAELDPYRQNQLLEILGDRFQTLITTTHLSSFDAQWLKESQILAVEKGKISSF